MPQLLDRWGGYEAGGPALQTICLLSQPYSVFNLIETSSSCSSSHTQAFPQCVFDHWENITADPLVADSQAFKLVTDIRKRKGIKLEVQPLGEYEDKL